MVGFVSRRPGGEGRKVGGIIGGELPEVAKVPAERPRLGDSQSPRQIRGGISRSEIDESLRGIDESEEQAPPRRRKIPGAPSNRGKWIKRVLLAIVIIGVIIGCYVGIKAIIASGNVFRGSIFDIFQNVPLKQDASGRTNIIILGTSEDDPGHQGGNLTDSMMILSIDQTNKNAYMVSIPRDLYVKYGRACNSGYEGKINEYYGCVHDGTGVDADRAALTKEAAFIGNITGLSIQYGVNVNYTVMREMVKAVGGSITVDIEGDGDVPAGIKPGSVMDSNFDWKCGTGNRRTKCPPRGHFIDYGPGPNVLDAEHALYLAQARGDSAPTWGLAQSNFDREKNQQKIIKALREKAISAGVLSDFGKVSAIIDALGNNLRTTFETKEFRTLVSLAQGIKSEDINSISLNDSEDLIMGSGTIDGMSVVQPSAGLYDYSDLRAYLKQKLSSDPIVREAAPVLVVNASGVSGLAQSEADKLEAAKYTIDDVTTAPVGNYARFTLYQIGTGNSGTANKLKQRYGIKISSGKPPVTVDSTTRFVLVIGPRPDDSSNDQ
jgi:anionic cell wall polymer biosynthesis LytR-Cps2A-Psr (LCP) family protein